MNADEPRYRTLASWLRDLFGEPVRKVTLDAGLGCPNRDGTLSLDGCIYCNPRGSGTGAHSCGISVREQVCLGIELLSKRFRCSKFIAYFQSYTNTYSQVEVLDRLYSEALERPEVVGLAVGTRPDCVPDPVLDLLAGLARDRLVWIEYGLQSIHDRTLERVNRGHGSSAFFDAVQRSAARGIIVVVHLILGLPGESIQDMVQTARAVADSSVHGVKLHPLYVVRGTRLARMYAEGLYQPMSEDQAIEATLAVLEVLPPEMVIHRTTSDPHVEELVAPIWMLDKRSVRRHLTEAMNRRDFRQGSHSSSRLQLEEC
ncbi:MAG: TIGR01212 family radical SAM protein [Deltaproteobacteria bacterium]|nr:TIGR01212 family radical SAM protein [Deltaproteobacteria bacterium]